MKVDGMGSNCLGSKPRGIKGVAFATRVAFIQPCVVGTLPGVGGRGVRQACAAASLRPEALFFFLFCAAAC